jgi:hypothetical protein
MGAPSFFAELKRRQIYRGGVMYIVAGWVIVQVATTVFPYFDIPSWAIRLLVVVILLGFPIALVALWMFESALPNDPQMRLHDRRQGTRDASVEMAKLMEVERLERHKETQQLIAALGQRRGEAPEETQPALASLRTRQATPAPINTPPPRKRKTMLFLSLLALLILASGVWALVAPQAALQPVAASGELAKDYVVPGFRQVENFGVTLLAPVLNKLGIPIAPERVLMILMVLLALLVMRDFYRQLVNSRRRRTARQ